MNFDDFSEQERETKSWLVDLDNFGKPPPPRFLPGLTNGTLPGGGYRPRSVIGTETYENLHTDEANSPAGGYLSDFEPSVLYDMDPTEFVNSAQFMQKVRQFQQSNSHPYASRRRVETTKKIGEEGGTRGNAGLLMERAEKPAANATKRQLVQQNKISKAEVTALTESVRKTNRPVNPWADKEQPSEKNYVLPELTTSPTPTNAQQIADNGSFDTRSIGTASSSAYSSFSSVGGHSNASYEAPSLQHTTAPAGIRLKPALEVHEDHYDPKPNPILDRKASESYSTDSNRTVIDSYVGIYNRPLKIETIDSKENQENLGKKQVPIPIPIPIRENKENNEPTPTKTKNYQNLPGPPAFNNVKSHRFSSDAASLNRSLLPSSSPVDSDPDYVKLFDDFETDLEKLSRRSRSKTPETNNHYPSPCEPPIFGRSKSNGEVSATNGSAGVYRAQPVKSLGSSRQNSLNDPSGPSGPSTPLSSNVVRRIAIPPEISTNPPAVSQAMHQSSNSSGVYRTSSSAAYSSRSTPSRPTFHQYRQLSSGGSSGGASGLTSPASSAMPSPNPNLFSPTSVTSGHSGTSFQSGSGVSGGLREYSSRLDRLERQDRLDNSYRPPPPAYDQLTSAARKRDIIVDRIPPGESVIPSPVVLRRNNLAFYNKHSQQQQQQEQDRKYYRHSRNSAIYGQQKTAAATPPAVSSPGPFVSNFSNANGKSSLYAISPVQHDKKAPPLSTRSQSASALVTAAGPGPVTNGGSQDPPQSQRGRPTSKVNTRQVPITSSPLPWRNRTASGTSGSTNKSASSEALQNQQRKYEKLQEEVAEQMDRNLPVYGVCHKCAMSVTDVTDATQALGHLYHSQCFTCHSCSRALKGKRFYEAGGKIYCEEDYLYSGFQQTAERCAGCGHLIMEMILQAVGKAFHPDCFRCLVCKRCLDGIPFTVDKDGKVYCVQDYHQIFAPKCSACEKPITPVSGSDETVRVHAMDKDYHIDCYICEGCGLQLTDEPAKRCYPFGNHLLCQGCHMHWSKTGSVHDPITDV